MQLHFLDAAQNDLRSAYEYYRDKSVGLEKKFALSIQDTLQRIENYPKFWSRVSVRLRRCRVSGFPFDILYHLGKDQILILAVFHERREPKSWLDREENLMP